MDLIKNIKEDMYKTIHDDRCKFFLGEGLKCVTGRNYNEKSIGRIYRSYKKKITMPWIDIRITNACTLKCVHCTEWNPYLPDKDSFEADSVIKDIRCLTEYVDYIFGISLIGGEPFVNQNIDKILEYCLKNKKIGYIVITTNGTLMPNEKTLMLLKNKKVKTIFSRYDDSKNDNYFKLLDFLIKNECNYYVYNSCQRFYDLGMPNPLKKESSIVTTNKYKNCWLRHCCHLAKGNLYRCPRTYAGLQMGLFDENDVSNERIDISVIQSKEQCAKLLKQFYSLPYLKTCSACLPENMRKIYKAGIQIEGVIQ